jgi:hypothetical protein
LIRVRLHQVGEARQTGAGIGADPTARFAPFSRRWRLYSSHSLPIVPFYSAR